ncbi:25022_t:CDS:2, partial [Cetraspora pellucida]
NMQSYMDDKLKQVIEVVRYITDNPNYIVEGRWFCQHWKCKHRLPCLNVEECKNNCPHEPQCQTEMQCLSKWTCKHEPECNKRKKLEMPTSNTVRRLMGIFECQKRPSREKWKCPHNPECYNKWKCQNKWQCQHKEKCDMSNPNLNECQNKCQHRCKTEKKCKEKSQALFQQLERQYKDEWKYRHQCEDSRECLRKWECPHESEFPGIVHNRKCKDRRKCRTIGWHCQHTPPCMSTKSCQEKWDGENEWNCKHITEYGEECQSNWQCLSDPKHRNKWQCQNKLTLSYSQSELKACLEKVHQPTQLNDFFTKQSEKNPQVWAKARGDVFYRVFGRWNCNVNEDHIWDSSYTWVSLQKFVDSSQTGYQAHNFMTNIRWGNIRKFRADTKRYNFQNAQTGLQKHDYVMIKCHLCWKSASILCWKRIVGSRDAPLHDRELCEKCRSGNLYNILIRFYNVYVVSGNEFPLNDIDRKRLIRIIVMEECSRCYVKKPIEAFKGTKNKGTNVNGLKKTCFECRTKISSAAKIKRNQKREEIQVQNWKLQ